MKKTVVQQFLNDSKSLETNINQFLAEWQEKHSSCRIIGITSHPCFGSSGCCTASNVYYTFLYEELEQDA